MGKMLKKKKFKHAACRGGVPVDKDMAKLCLGGMYILLPGVVAALTGQDIMSCLTGEDASSFAETALFWSDHLF